MKTPELLYYQFGSGVTAFSTMRSGGYSTGSYGEFNINSYCGDDAGSIQRNKVALCNMLGIDTSRLVMPHQVHGTECLMIDSQFMELPVEQQKERLEGIDALMTNEPGILIGVSTADCIPVLLFDKRQRIASAIHAGWRGTVRSITKMTVMAMTERYGSRPSDILAQIGPGISLDCFEVGDEVYEAFVNAGFYMPAISRRMEKWHIDLKECNRRQLMDAGLPSENICVCMECTQKNGDAWFSARRQGISSGRIFTAIMMR